MELHLPNGYKLKLDKPSSEITEELKNHFENPKYTHKLYFENGKLVDDHFKKI